MTLNAIYHIARRTEWEAAQYAGIYAADTLGTEGFIHCSEAHQIIGVANRLFRGRTDLLLLRLDPARLSSDLRFEPGGGDVFPHIYGPINATAVVEVIPFPPGPNGTFELPTGLGNQR